MTRLAVCGGVYANPWALEAFAADARERGAERLLCLGDLGGFGAACDAVWPLLLEHGIECIAGNYDIAIGRGDPDCGCGYTDERDNHFAQLMYDYTRAHTGADFAAWMHALPGELRETIGGVDVHAVHGSPLAVNDFVWESLEDDELALRVRASGACGAPLHAHGHPVAARVRGHARRQRGHDRPAGQRRPARGLVRDRRSGGRARERGARAARLRLARAGGGAARGGPARAVRRDGRDRLVDVVPGGGPAAPSGPAAASISTGRATARRR